MFLFGVGLWTVDGRWGEYCNLIAVGQGVRSSHMIGGG